MEKRVGIGSNDTDVDIFFNELISLGNTSKICFIEYLLPQLSFIKPAMSRHFTSYFKTLRMSERTEGMNSSFCG